MKDRHLVIKEVKEKREKEIIFCEVKFKLEHYM